MDWWRMVRSGGYVGGVLDEASVDVASWVALEEDCEKDGTGGLGVDDLAGVFSLLDVAEP
jgi:hypothetical protein